VGFQADFTDPVTGEVWMGARWYNPSTAVFLSRDSVRGELSTPISLNRYTYGWANPLTYWDPDGKTAYPTARGDGYVEDWTRNSDGSFTRNHQRVAPDRNHLAVPQGSTLPVEAKQRKQSPATQPATVKAEETTRFTQEVGSWLKDFYGANYRSWYQLADYQQWLPQATLNLAAVAAEGFFGGQNVQPFLGYSPARNLVDSVTGHYQTMASGIVTGDPQAYGEAYFEIQTLALGYALGPTLTASRAARTATLADDTARVATNTLRSSVIDDVIAETQAGARNLTSRFTLSADEALTAGERWVGPGYTELGKPGSGVFRSADGTRQFRIDSGSITGAHSPGLPHVHLETIVPGSPVPIVNNHIPIAG
jgi:RHS repeat-associated protein